MDDFEECQNRKLRNSSSLEAIRIMLEPFGVISSDENGWHVDAEKMYAAIAGGIVPVELQAKLLFLNALRRCEFDDVTDAV